LRTARDVQLCAGAKPRLRSSAAANAAGRGSDDRAGECRAGSRSSRNLGKLADAA
jgi:hypothetical protein